MVELIVSFAKRFVVRYRDWYNQQYPMARDETLRLRPGNNHSTRNWAIRNASTNTFHTPLAISWRRRSPDRERLSTGSSTCQRARRCSAPRSTPASHSPARTVRAPCLCRSPPCTSRRPSSLPPGARWLPGRVRLACSSWGPSPYCGQTTDSSLKRQQFTDYWTFLRIVLLYRSQT